jgi:hypothetical protein
MKWTPGKDKVDEILCLRKSIQSQLNAQLPLSHLL